jgi:MFS family permease
MTSGAASPVGRAGAIRRAFGLERGVAALAAGLFVFGFGQELWFRYLPEYLRFLGATPLAVGAFGAVKDLLDAAYAYPGGAIADRAGTRTSLLLFGAVTVGGYAILAGWRSIAGVFAGIVLVMAWPSLGLPATFAMIGEELRGAKRIVGFTVQAIVKRIPIVIAPIAGGLLIGRLGMLRGMRAGFFASIALAGAATFGLARAFRGHPARPPAAGGPAPLPPALRRLVAFDVLVRLCEGLPDVFLVVWVIEVRGFPAARFGILTAILTATSIASYFPAAVLAGRTDKKWWIVLTYSFFTLFPLAVFAARSFPALAAAFAVGGLREIGEPARKAFIVDAAPTEARGRTVGKYYTIRGFSVAGAAVAGGLLWTIAPRWTFLAAAALGAAGTLGAALFLPRPERSAPLPG